MFVFADLCIFPPGQRQTKTGIRRERESQREAERGKREGDTRDGQSQTRQTYVKKFEIPP